MEARLTSLTESQVQELKAAFVLMDKNHDGRVNASELKSMSESLGILLTDGMIRHVLQQVNRRDDGMINEEEFMTWMAKHQTSIKDDVMEDLLAAFRVFDKDRNGFITRDELRVAMEMIGEPVSDEQLDELIKVTDVDNDGRINYEEFVRILL
ncbi:calcium-binding protein E63-1-like isoform X1 [Limulus polyphemus]|uniref:Calcium-binding protein E63-1-like isoform X1 n=2 Tax=Limulus polyphemus TaxID=6850 RepID=A0ABM1SEP7_LIMPO|nr:calcium-binding protein E63-1-like isoform X1 [Limulus polyphemus]